MTNMKLMKRYLVCLLVLACLSAGPCSRLKVVSVGAQQRPRTVQIFEPPSPTINAAWPEVRKEQLTFLQRLEEWGMTVEIEKKDELAIENSPNRFTFSMAWVTPTKFEISAGIKLPENALNERGSFKYKGEYSETGVNQNTSGQIEFSNGQKFSGAITSDAQRGLGYELGFEIERAMVALKGKFKSTSPELVSGGVEINLTKLYNFTQGAAVRGGEAGSVKLKLNPEKYVRRFIQFAPSFIEAASEPAKEAANAVRFQFNPVLLGAAIANDVSLWSRLKAVSEVNKGLQDEAPKGVKIKFNDNLLRELLAKGNSTQNRAGLIRLANALEQTSAGEARASLINAFISELKTGYLTARPNRLSGPVTLVSLRELVKAAEPYAASWKDLPAELRQPGGISRVVGYQVDQANDDVLLIGEVIPGAPALTIDDLIVGVRTVWKENAIPFCSLEPDPADFAGDQHVRVGGVPATSGFARVMLDADYLMKRMGAGLEAVNAPGYLSYVALLRQEGKQAIRDDGAERFWFYPAPLQTGDIELSPAGDVVLFNTTMQVLSEQMVLSHDALLGTGKVTATADKWAAMLTQALPDLERLHPEFQHLHGLFDLVLLGKTWQRLGVTSPWITRLAALPYEQVNVPLKYKGIKVKYMEDEAKEYYLFGGVRVRMAASVNALLLAEQAALKSLRLGASSRGGAVARRLDQVRLVLPAGMTRRTQALDIAAVLALMRRGDVTTASDQLRRLSEAEPFDPELWCLRAMLHLQQKSYEAALADAARALELDAENPRIVAAASIIQFEANFLTGRTEPALESIERAVRALPESARAHILKGDALAALQQTADARAEYREALRLDPNAMMANVSFGLLELSEGWVVRGSKLIEKARLQTRVEADVPTVKAALALAEIGISILGDTETHLAKASDYARDVMADPASDPLARIRALFAQTQLALIRDDAPAAENLVKQALEIAPANPTPLIALAYWAHEQKRDELARRYLNSAEQLAPDHPAVKKLRALMRNTP